MKTYRIVLTSLGTVLVEADSAVEKDGTLWFIRKGEVHAKYALTIVTRYEEIRTPAASPPRDKSIL
jgi:hypothetical protein